MNTRTWILALAALLTACGGSGGAAPTAGDGGAELPAGTSESTFLARANPGEDIQVIAEELGVHDMGDVPGTEFHEIAIDSDDDLEERMEAFENDDRIAETEPDLGIQAPEGDGATLPAGGLLLSVELPTQTELLRIGLEAANARSTGFGVRVAVIDTGVIASHEFLAGRIDEDGWDFIDQDADPEEERDFQDNDGDGLTDEGWGHGTFVASLVLAIAPDARIVPFRVLDSDAIGNSSRVAAAITMAADRGVHVINLSASTPETIRVIRDAVQSARERGVIVVASAGNTGSDDVNFPASIDAAISVTSIDPSDVKAAFASFGSDIDVVAPGVELHGAYPSPIGTARWSGTSFSAAIVSGGVALVRSLFPEMNSGDVTERVTNTAVDVSDANPGIASKLGEGRIDLDAATAPGEEPD